MYCTLHWQAELSLDYHSPSPSSSALLVTLTSSVVHQGSHYDTSYRSHRAARAQVSQQLVAQAPGELSAVSGPLGDAAGAGYRLRLPAKQLKEARQYLSQVP